MAEGGDVKAAAACTALDEDIHRLAPADAPSALLDERFVRCVVTGEHGLLTFAGVVQLERGRFFREHVFPRLDELSPAVRDSAMLAVLHGLHALANVCRASRLELAHRPCPSLPVPRPPSSHPSPPSPRPSPSSTRTPASEQERTRQPFQTAGAGASSIRLTSLLKREKTA